ncbi:hypothetical protein I545_5971 [Mycobacterium kansasii 662]|uniref:Uncharacterized protein n=2 Tax=Mycobacterium TaxID=1763 RepID=X7YR32_MYCKA|nr:hypothetical protein I545_5971 [Mycobacterium kansasii 662]
MVSVAGGASEGASAAAQAGTHIAHQLYTSGLGATAEAGAVAKEAVTELGSGEFGQALKRAWRPAEQLRESFENIQQFHQDLAQTLGDAVEISYNHYRPRFAAALAGTAGDALLAAHDATVKNWSDHQDKHTAAATAAAKVLGHIKGLQGRIDNLAEAGEEEFNKAVRNRDPLAAMDVWTRYNGLAETSMSEAAGNATSAIRAADFTIPLDVPIPKDGKQTEPGKGDKNPADGDHPADANATPDGSQTATKPATQQTATPPSATPDATQGDVKPPATPQGDGMQTPVTQGRPTMLGQLPQAMSGAAGGGQGGGSGVGGSSMSGLGSAFKPASSMGSSMPTSPASSMPSAPSMPASSSAASPMSNAGSSFQSGLASGMSATGGGNALSNLASPVSVTQQGLPTQQVGGAPAFGSGSAGVPLSAPGGDTGLGSSGASSGGGAAPGGGGTQMMPPAAVGGAAPMAPYSAPGAGAGGAPAGGGSGTAPAASSGQSATAGAAAPGPVVAGGSGATVSAPGVAAMTNVVNPDLLLAQRVLGGLVRGCEDWPAPIAWAVGVVKTAVGSQVVIASSLGGGGYVPSTVFVPATARLAVADPALPFGLAQKWMGCQKPSKILVDHFEQLSRRVAGAELSAMVTTELWPQEPAGVTDFLGVQHRQALGLVRVAPTLDGAHQHRLTALDPVLAQRVSSIGIGSDVSAYAAAQLTAAVIQAAGQPDDTGKPLATVREGNILASVQRGTANDMSWKLYDDLLRDAYGDDHESPDSHAPLDHDGSEVTQALTLWYQHFFCLGRVIELVRLWKGGAVPPLAEIAYCGVQAGFGSVVAATISAIENEIRGRRSGTPS